MGWTSGYNHSNKECVSDSCGQTPCKISSVCLRVWKDNSKMKSSIFWDKILCSLIKINKHFGETCHFHLQGWGITKQENNVKAGDMQGNWIADISDYIGNWREMEDSNWVPAGLAQDKIRVLALTDRNWGVWDRNHVCGLQTCSGIWAEK
jgi:hypothetical protein